MSIKVNGQLIAGLGKAGVGVPSGGAEGQMLVKKSDADYDTEWIDASAEIEVDTTLTQSGMAADAKSVGDQIANKQNKITGTAGQFVVIGDDGNVTTKTIPSAEEASF